AALAIGLQTAPHSSVGSDDAALAARLGRVLARHPAVVGPAAGHRCGRGTHSRTADGQVVCWSVPQVGGERFAVDAECADVLAPPALTQRWSGPVRAGSLPGGVVAAWTATEVVAKLTDTPVLLLAARGPVTSVAVTHGARRVVLRHERRRGLHLCFGLAVVR
ncbi:MAG: hypothetical protein ACRCXL_12810, partial [Dermatophilaceae bacterium]